MQHIDQLFRLCGCSRGAVPPQPGPRYERSRTNELLHIDTDAKLVPLLEWLDDCFELWDQPIELMSDNGSPVVRLLPGLLLTGFGCRLAERRSRHIRTQISTPWTHGGIEAFWAVVQREVLDRQHPVSLVKAEATLTRFAEYYKSTASAASSVGKTPAGRYGGTPFTDRGFANIAALAYLQPWQQATMPAARRVPDPWRNLTYMNGSPPVGMGTAARVILQHFGCSSASSGCQRDLHKAGDVVQAAVDIEQDCRRALRVLEPGVASCSR